MTGALSPSATSASAVMGDGFAQLNATTLAGTEDPGLDYSQLMGFYPALEGTSTVTQNPYTHVDPTQILNVEQGDAGYQSFHASPSSDGWGNGMTSAHTSPDGYDTSNASSPPSTESNSGAGANARGAGVGSGANARKYVSLKQSAQELQGRKSGTTMGGVGGGDGRSPTSTPDPPDGAAGNAGTGGGGTAGSGVGQTQAKGAVDDGESPTLCTNCQTTNTPLWRRDPEGHPLCECPRKIYPRCMLIELAGNACGLFYVRVFCTPFALY
jgi:GATA-binding protein